MNCNNVCFKLSSELIKDGAATEIKTREYKPTPADRDGFGVRCTDPTNPDWRSVSEDGVEKTSTILPSCKFMGFFPSDNQQFAASFHLCSSVNIGKSVFFWEYFPKNSPRTVRGSEEIFRKWLGIVLKVIFECPRVC